MTAKTRNRVNFLTDERYKAKSYVRPKRKTETEPATCSLCGKPGRCHHVEHGWVCLESLEKCAEKYADLMAEEDAHG